MTDITFFPSETLMTIADYLTPAELAQFRLVSRAFNYAATDMQFIQPLYNRLYAMDSTLPATSEAGNQISLFNQAFLKIRAVQQQEIDSLRSRYPHFLELKILNAPPATIHDLENRHELLNDINCFIIQQEIDKSPNSEQLKLLHLDITRLPFHILKTKNPDYFNKLTHLSCHNNKLIALDLRELLALKTIHCEYNQLTHLNVQGLLDLEVLVCFDNPLPFLNLQGLVSLKHLTLFKNNTSTHLNVENCSNLQSFFFPLVNNPLIDIKLKGSSLATMPHFQELEIMLLLKQLSAAKSDQDISSITARLDKNFTLANCITHLGFKAGSSLYSAHSKQSMTNFYDKVCSYLPSFSSVESQSVTNNATPEITAEENQSNKPIKRAREEDSNNTQSEHPAKKRRQ